MHYYLSICFRYQRYLSRFCACQASHCFLFSIELMSNFKLTVYEQENDRLNYNIFYYIDEKAAENA